MKAELDNIDGLVSKDDLYRLISDLRMKGDISQAGAQKFCTRVRNIKNMNHTEISDKITELLLRVDRLLDCGPLFVHYKERLEAENIREEISDLLHSREEETNDDKNV